jgi:hypothetical protein
MKSCASFIKSVFLGSQGSYQVLGAHVDFKEDPFCPPAPIDGVGFISSLANKCLNSHACRWVTQGYCHVFVHEMGHALACKLLTGSDAKITIETDTCTGLTYISPTTYNHVPKWRQSVIDFSGPMFNVAFCTIKIVAANALKSYVPRPVTFLLAGGAVAWISGELLYAYVSAHQKQDNADFSSIVSRGKTHLIIATTTLVGQVALGLWALTKFIA